LFTLQTVNQTSWFLHSTYQHSKNLEVLTLNNKEY